MEAKPLVVLLTSLAAGLGGGWCLDFRGERLYCDICQCPFCLSTVMGRQGFGSSCFSGDPDSARLSGSPPFQVSPCFPLLGLGQPELTPSLAAHSSSS